MKTPEPELIPCTECGKSLKISTCRDVYNDLIFYFVECRSCGYEDGDSYRDVRDVFKKWGKGLE